MRRWWSLLVLALGWSVALGACGPAGVHGRAAVEPAPVPTKVRNAHEIARAIVGGQVDALVFVDRLRHHPLGPRVAVLRPWGNVLDGTGIDPLRDLERAYVTAPTIRDEEASALVGEHQLPAERVRAAVDALIARSQPPGRWLQGLGVPAAQVTVRGRRRVIALVEPNVIVVLPEPYASHAARFVGTAGCPDPVGPEAVVATAIEPARTLHGAAPVPIPPTLRRAHAVITPAADGGADLHVQAESTTPAQAQADADVLSRGVAHALTVDMGFFRMRLLVPIVFRAEQHHVKGDRHLTPGELDRIFMLVAATMPR